MLDIASKDNGDGVTTREFVPQRQIEIELAKVVNLGNIECIYVFSAEGLLVAGVQGRSDYSQEDALELAYSIHDAIELLKDAPGFEGVLEALLVTRTRRSIAVRKFTVFGQLMTLVLVVPRGMRYRAHTNRLIRVIKEIGQHSIQ